MTRQYDNYADLITFSRSSGGTALRPVSYGSELVTNGTFDSDISGWTDASEGTGSTSWDASGALSLNNPAASSVEEGIAYGVITTVIGRLYTLTASKSGGNSIVHVGDSAGGNNNYQSPNAADDVVTTFVATATTTYVTARNFNSATPALVDNISVKEVLFDQPNAPLTLFNHPAGIPRIEYDADGNRLGLLIEESRTNLVTYSEDFSNAYWNDASPSTTVSLSDITSPAGTPVYKITGAAGNNYRLAQNVVTNSKTKSIYARTVSGTGTVNILSHNSVAESFVTLTEEWQRFSLPSDTSETGGSNFYLADFRGGGTLTEILVYGAQLEAGAFSTSYIPTSGATATRTADVASIPVSAFGYNQSEGTVVVEVSSINGTIIGSIGDGSFSNDLRFGSVGSDTVRGVGSGFVNTVTNGSYNSETGKIAIGIEEDNYYTAKNGVGAGVADTSASLPPNPVNIYIGKDYGNYINGHIKSIKYFPRRLTNDQLVEITT